MAITFDQVVSQDGTNPLGMLLSTLREMQQEYGSFTKNAKELTEVIKGTFTYNGHFDGVDSWSSAQEAFVLVSILHVLYEMKLIDGKGHLTDKALAYL